MPRDLPVGNGRLLLNFDRSYNLRDIYWPHVGQELHTNGDISHTGVRVDGQFAWLDAPEWQREMVYESETLVTRVSLTHARLQLELVFHDCVDFARPIFLRQIEVSNRADRPREVRLFFHYDWHIWGAADANTVFYDPGLKALVAYKRRAYFLMSGQVQLSQTQAPQVGIARWAAGVKEFHGAEGTWRDAEDGELSCNPIAQGSVDGTLALYLAAVPAGATALAYHWLAAGFAFPDVVEHDRMIHERGPASVLIRTRNYWQSWVNKQNQDFANLAPELVDLYKRSLLILRTQIDHGGAIIAANDADVEHFSSDSYSYMWPRDGALVANALSHAGYSEVTAGFFTFCNAVLTADGYLLHKYNPDRSWGSSWHPWVGSDGRPQLPIQEDETALVIYSLWQHYLRFSDIEFVAPHFRSLVVPAADFMTAYRDEHTHLLAPSYDLWEERQGILSYTTSAVYAGLAAAAKFAQLFGEQALALKYQQAAAEIKDAAIRYLWDEQRGHFLRMITKDADGTLHPDETLDSSLCALFQFGMFAADDREIVQTMQKLEQTLGVRTAIGGMARYENDSYYQVTHDREQAPGNPWFICTLWLAQYRIARAHSMDELQQALPLLEWAHARALPSGVMAEQVHPFTGEPLSVSPLTWSHAEFVLTVRWYIGKYHHFRQNETRG
ncbi:MAG TPA: glycoside hydrolase family 15 protein [Ktedonobacteraceae bacterium]|jgi:GH15 family glucan-1,4-alpha-glucosidase